MAKKSTAQTGQAGTEQTTGTNGDQGAANAGAPAATDAGSNPNSDPNDTAPAITQTPAAQPAQAPKVLAEKNGVTSPDALDLLLDACQMYGIDPDPDAEPQELLSWRYVAADRRQRTPAQVILVTAGGRKLDLDDNGDISPEAEETLRNVFNAYRIDPATKERVPGDLPETLTLPRVAVTGIPEATAHRYEGGYLRSGGRREAARRASKR